MPGACGVWTEPGALTGVLVGALVGRLVGRLVVARARMDASLATAVLECKRVEIVAINNILRKVFMVKSVGEEDIWFRFL